MKRFRELAVALALALVLIWLAREASAVGLASATYVKTFDTKLPASPGMSATHFIAFKVTGTSTDTYLTSGVSPSAAATGLGFTAFLPGTLRCDQSNVGWTTSTTSAGAVLYRSATVQLGNAVSLNANVLNCTAVAY